MVLCVTITPINFIDPTGFAEYRIGGLNLAPQFVFDHGFAYNPNAVATKADKKSWNEWGRNAFLAGFVPWLQDAAKMYKHYRDNTGTDMKVDYQRAYREDSTIKSYIDTEVGLMTDFALKSIASGSSSFEIIGTMQAIPNGKSENWQKTIGAHNVYGHGVVSTDKNGNVVMVVTFYMEDMYNFNPGQADIASGTPDAVNGRFSELGWAKEFKTYGTYTTTVTLVKAPPKTTPPPSSDKKR